MSRNSCAQQTSLRRFWTPSLVLLSSNYVICSVYSLLTAYFEITQTRREVALSHLKRSTIRSQAYSALRRLCIHAFLTLLPPDSRAFAAFRDCLVATRQILPAAADLPDGLAWGAGRPDRSTQGLSAQCSQHLSTQSFFKESTDSVKRLDTAAVGFHDTPMQQTTQPQVRLPCSRSMFISAYKLDE